MNANSPGGLSASAGAAVTPIVRLEGITKTFPGVIANEDVTLDLVPGEIHALLGENGAGKSTLMNVLTGIYRPDGGRIVLDGKPADLSTPLQAIAAGIGMVHQHFKLVRSFTVAENIHLGWDDTPKRVSRRVLEERTGDLAQRFNLDIDPGALVADLSTGEQQQVEILRVLSRDARVLILDEPTAVLTPPEAQKLFTALRAFVKQGNAVIFISHKLDEVLQIADRVTVLRGGRKVATEQTANSTPASLAQLMVGHDIVASDLRARPEGAAPISDAPVLSLEGVSARDADGQDVLRDITLNLHGGEILGIAGVAGNGQRELSQVLTGILRASQGRIMVDGSDLSHATGAVFADKGIGHIPEDRLHSGLAPALSITDNAVMREYKSPGISPRGLFRPGAARALATQIAEAAQVSIPSYTMPVRNLSGGNQQRLVAQREMRIAHKVLVAAYPSRGLDVGAIDAMMRFITDLRDQGAGVVLISEELEELLNVSDRLAVLYEGRIMDTVQTEDADLDRIGLLMGGRTGL